MKDQNQTFRSAQTPGDARDILERLYREIGISAVAAALQATQSKPRETDTEDAKLRAQRRFSGYAA
ncbi:hypothetical protein [uncultured Methylovirgula sp.]|uniref:hypothetical protein n=1 Tax=uncultured Methylovirgula sp. TaxID=1285960 RepID=UPI002617B2D1|nr:hypothetical protein [uncultured Methylovirgula sp.]